VVREGGRVSKLRSKFVEEKGEAGRIFQLQQGHYAGWSNDLQKGFKGRAKNGRSWARHIEKRGKKKGGD